ncbi:GumN family protein [uncultured Desulfobacterium sp.]|uniref:GumN family protein n=1 Tax=uncultured Desulfobacterium sp. TaxID=201089 RepID=A0A445MQY2_9BACT|nr:GumN family protein [uncultured Desulfobacterium sp.]
MIKFKKQIITIGIIFSLCLSAIASSKEIQRSCLWRVTSGTNSVFLLGSIHVLKDNSTALNPSIEKAFNDSRVLVFELDPKDMSDAKAQQMLLAKGLLPEGQSLDKVISKETYNLAKSRASQLGLDIATFNRFKPWLFVMRLAMAKMQRLGFSNQKGIDTYFYSKAAQSGKMVIGLETFAQQMDMLDIMSTMNQDDLVRQAIKDLDVMEEELGSIIEAWTNGDIKALEQVIFKSFKDFPLIYKALIINRNIAWAAKITKLLEKDDNHMVIVGAAHLAGKDGVVELLKKKGFDVEQL